MKEFLKKIILFIMLIGKIIIMIILSFPPLEFYSGASATHTPS